MPLLPEISEFVKSRHSSQPRTILGFLFGMSTLIVTAAVIISVVLIDRKSTWPIAIVLGTATVIVISIIVAVIRQAKSNPAGLMLGQITGTEYEAISRLTLGDSSQGERVQAVASGFIIEGANSQPTNAEVEPSDEEGS